MPPKISGKQNRKGWRFGPSGVEKPWETRKWVEHSHDRGFEGKKDGHLVIKRAHDGQLVAIPIHNAKEIRPTRLLEKDNLTPGCYVRFNIMEDEGSPVFHHSRWQVRAPDYEGKILRISNGEDPSIQVEVNANRGFGKSIKTLKLSTIDPESWDEGIDPAKFVGERIRVLVIVQGHVGFARLSTITGDLISLNSTGLVVHRERSSERHPKSERLSYVEERRARREGAITIPWDRIHFVEAAGYSISEMRAGIDKFKGNLPDNPSDADEFEEEVE